MTERLIILVPADAKDAESEYWRNFVWRITRAVEQERLTCRVIVDRRRVGSA